MILQQINVQYNTIQSHIHVFHQLTGVRGLCALLLSVASLRGQIKDTACNWRSEVGAKSKEGM